MAGTHTRRWPKRLLTGAGLVAAVLLVLALGVAAWVWVHLGRSLPQTDGTATLTGLSAEVIVERDAHGTPTISGASRIDVARALGFIHAQDRFFQMDLARRRAAGELAEILGRTALPTDRASRLHRFRDRAARVLAAASADERAQVEAYTAGVNAGLAALRAAPFEYLLLRATPKPWQAEDSVLVIASMFFSLQDATGTAEARAGALYDVFPAPLAEFLNATTSDWDTPLLGDALPAPVPPGPEVFDLRTAAPVQEPINGGSAVPTLALDMTEVEADSRGSNNWAVAGSRTADGRAILANDMHLGLSVPNIWYRASLVWTGSSGRPMQATGVTLPGVPSLIVGSNGTIAWGFTNTTADWTDRVRLTLAGDDHTRYLTPDGPRSFEVTQETIAVAGEASETLEVRGTIWGPVVGPDTQGRLHAIAWVAHHPEGLNLRLSAMENAASLDEALTIASLSGVPGQNCVLADRDGHIAWTVAGRIPRRAGFDGRLPASWADGTRRWDGWYSPAEYPRVVNPDSGVIVTANNRVVSGRDLERLGDGGYDPGARGRQIRDGLLAIDRADIDDMLRVQLDDRALLMERWRDLALSVLTDTATTTPGRQQFRRLLQETWTGHASTDSVGYRLARQFRLTVAELALAPFVARVRTLEPGFPSTPGRSLEGAVWALLTHRPAHLLDPKYADWPALVLGAIDRTVTALSADGRRPGLDARTWGEANTLQAQHPITRAVPQLGRWLDLPRQPLPGDSHMPRFQSATAGASERLAVSPGHEAAGYFHMPGGQSGHPRSPHYRDGHDAWVRGIPTPFLPGPTVARLVLRP